MIESAAHHAQVGSTPSRIWDRTFPGRPDQIRHARQCLAEILDGCPVADDAVLCLSELASNSVIHSDSAKPGGTFTVRTEIRDGEYVRFEVHDGGGRWLERRHTDGRAHGLAIVRDLATDSGVGGNALTGWIAWARLDWPATETAMTEVHTASAPIQGLQALSAELARCHTPTAWISAGAHEGELILVQGHTDRLRDGVLLVADWPVQPRAAALCDPCGARPSGCGPPHQHSADAAGRWMRTAVRTSPVRRP